MQPYPTIGYFNLPAQSLKPAVFLDRDGTLNASVIRNGRPYPPVALNEFVLLLGVTNGCAQLKNAGFTLVIATNQPDVGRGTQTQTMVESMNDLLRAQVPQIDLVQVCYHGGADHGQPCDCRKPKPAMLLNAARVLGLDLARSWMVGDRWRDVDCGHTAGCRTIFIDHGYEEKLRILPDFVAKDFTSAVGIILAHPSATLVH
jgi:D-glycero-D-manno-heptose 1,7-bisphosphate phosphatase